MNYNTAIRRNIQWFKTSGVMYPADGFWGVAERVAMISDREALEKIKQHFPCQTQVREAIHIIEHRRADCNFQASLLFLRAGAYFDDADMLSVGDTLLQYLLCRSTLADRRQESPTHGMWGWAAPSHMHKFWIDDNAWVATILLMLSRERPELRGAGLAAARQLFVHLRPFLDHLKTRGPQVMYPGFDTTPVLGIKLNPHWCGLATMAWAHAAAVDDSLPYAQLSEDFHRLVFLGPSPGTVGSNRFKPPPGSNRVWTLSEYCYLTLTASIAAKQFGGAVHEDVARKAADILVAAQCSDGHFRAEHDESPPGEHLADLIYTDNWAALGLYHAWKFFDDSRYKAAFDKSCAFLAGIQDTSADPLFAGCWRGMYDTHANAWGGGDRYEGGAGSIYTGWTNVPISLALLFSLTGEDLFANRE